MIAWSATANPLAAIVAGVVAEFFAASPTVVKAYRDPSSETPVTYWATCFATLMSVASSTKFDLANMLFPLYSIGINAIIASLAMRRRSALP